MKLPLVPDKIEEWNIRRLNELLKIVNVESETLEFKGRDFHSLTHLLCAMANLSGGYVVLGIEQDKPNNRFVKNGFDKGQEEKIGQRIANDMYNVEPTPEVAIKNIYNKNKKFYAILQIKSEDTKKPYFTKDTGQCYIRVSNVNKPAGRSVILNLAMTKMVSQEELHHHTEYLTKIYERLTGLRYYRRYEFIFLEVPDDYNQYKQGLYIFPNSDIDRTRYSDIKYLKHSGWALSHLSHDEYRQINQSWLEINNLVYQYNKGVLEFYDSLRKQLKQMIKSSYKNFVDVNEDEKWPPKGYSVKNISKFLYRNSSRAMTDDTTPMFERLRDYISQRSDDSHIIEGMGTLIQGQKRDDLNPDKLIMILYKLHKKSKIVEHLGEQHKITDKIYDMCRQFSKQLELLIDDLKGGETIKGFCKLGF
jgi:hypothetical protein